MPFRVTNITHELLNKSADYNKSLIIDGVSISPQQSSFFNWSVVPTGVNVMRLQNLINLESVSNNDLGVIIQHEAKSEEIIKSKVEIKPIKIKEETVEEKSKVIKKKKIE